MHGYPAVPECGMEVVFVRCRRLLKYITYEILHRKGRKGRKASAVGSFAVFAHFAVNQIMTNSSHPFSRSPAAPLSPSLSLGAPSRSAPPALDGVGAAGAFLLIWRSRGVDMYSCPCHRSPSGRQGGSQPYGFVRVSNRR